MKNYFNIWGMTGLLVLLLVACVKEDGPEQPAGYNTGKHSYEVIENNLAVFMSFFDLSLRMNAYLAVEEEERKEIQDNYFQDYEIFQDAEGRWTGVKEGDTLFTVVTDGLSLSTETAVWRLNGYGETCNGSMTVVCTGKRNWTLEAKSVLNDNRYSDAHLKIQYQGEMLPENFDQGDWIISGSGIGMVRDPGVTEEKKMTFEIAENLVKGSGSKYLFTKGILYIKLTDHDGLREERIKTEVKEYAERGRQLEITYRKDLYVYKDDGESVLFGPESSGR